MYSVILGLLMIAAGEGSDAPAPATPTPNPFNFDGLCKMLIRASDPALSVTERQRLMAQAQAYEQLMQRLARAPVTENLMSRAVFDIVFGDNAAETLEGKTHVVAIYADIDHFKRVNDNFGHAEGDRILREVGIAFEETMRFRAEDDVHLTRYGGEEIVAIVLLDRERSGTITDLYRNSIAARTEAFRALVEERISTPDGQPVTISMGVSVLPIGEGTNSREAAEAVVQHSIQLADQGLYDSKNDGRNQVTFRSPDPRQNSGRLEPGQLRFNGETYSAPETGRNPEPSDQN